MFVVEEQKIIKNRIDIKSLVPNTKAWLQTTDREIAYTYDAAGNRTHRAPAGSSERADAPWVQESFQNGIHKYLTGSPYFNTNYGPSTRLFHQDIMYSKWSLY